jgi:hypothetical protein
VIAARVEAVLECIEFDRGAVADAAIAEAFAERAERGRTVAVSRCNTNAKPSAPMTPVESAMPDGLLIWNWNTALKPVDTLYCEVVKNEPRSCPVSASTAMPEETLELLNLRPVVLVKSVNVSVWPRKLAAHARRTDEKMLSRKRLMPVARKPATALQSRESIYSRLGETPEGLSARRKAFGKSPVKSGWISRHGTKKINRDRRAAGAE